MHVHQLHQCFLSRRRPAFIYHICANTHFFPCFMCHRSESLAVLFCKSIKIDTVDFTQVCACEGKQPVHVLTGTERKKKRKKNSRKFEVDKAKTQENVEAPLLGGPVHDRCDFVLRPLKCSQQCSGLFFPLPNLSK